MVVDMHFKIAGLLIKLLTGAGQIAVACAVGYIAYRQWRTAQQQAETARNTLKYDLFDRWLKVYDALRESAHYATTADWREEPEQKFFDNIKELRWLFGKPIYDFVWNNVYTPLVDLWEANTSIHQSQHPLSDVEQEERRAAIANASRIRKQLHKDLAKLEEMMGEFLILNH